MATPFHSFDRSPLGAFVRSPLKARNGGGRIAIIFCSHGAGVTAFDANMNEVWTHPFGASTSIAIGAGPTLFMGLPTKIRQLDVSDGSTIWESGALTNSSNSWPATDGTKVYVLSVNGVGTGVVERWTIGGSRDWVSASFSQGRYLAADFNGNVYVHRSGRVSKFDSTGATVSLNWYEHLQSLPELRSIGTDIDNNVLIGTASTLHLVDPSGLLLASASVAVNSMAVATGGEVWVSQNAGGGSGSIRRYDSSLTQTWSVSRTPAPRGTAVDEDGNSYSGVSGGVEKRDQSGTLLATGAIPTGAIDIECLPGRYPHFQ